jgi:(p)ppGpp synthase/HD superfamily hydrolase
MKNLYKIRRKSMIYTEATKKALKLCFEAHKDQVDKSGLPYVFHPFHLAEQMKDENTTIVALLHDVVEDTEYTIQDLKNMGFKEEVIEAISMLTHDDDIPYDEYVLNIKSNHIARAVKLADLMHNSDLSRLENVTEKDLKRVEKYKRAIKSLTE